MVVTPPGRFSTITRQPSDSVSCLETMRLTMSGGVLAENGATKRTVPFGKAVSAEVCRLEAARKARAAIEAIRNEGHCMEFSISDKTHFTKDCLQAALHSRLLA